MSFPGVLHNYTGNLVAFELAPVSSSKVIVFMGGLGDGLLTVPYIHNVARELAPLGWSVIQIQMTSSFKGWGISSLDQDVREMRALVDYLRSEQGGARERIVLFGHSTGSQDTIHYLLSQGETVDAGILQASVSDREGFSQFTDRKVWDALNAEAKELVDEGEKDEILPLKFAKVMAGTPISAYRWCSLAIPGGDDDYFSSDLHDEILKGTFGRIQKPFLIAYSGADQFVPPSVDKSKVLQRWQASSDARFWSKHSGLITNADHQVKSESCRDQLCAMVRGFIEEFDL